MFAAERVFGQRDTAGRVARPFWVLVWVLTGGRFGDAADVVTTAREKAHAAAAEARAEADEFGEAVWCDVCQGPRAVTGCMLRTHSKACRSCGFATNHLPCPSCGKVDA